jgi:sugar-specific transcriptional regulator TrmB
MSHLQSLKKLGLTEYESRAYLSLARLGPSTVKEIVLDSNLPRNKAYEALQRLEQKNHVVSMPLSPRRYKITDPRLFKKNVKELDESVDSIIKLIEMPKAQEFKDLFWVMKGRKQLIETFAIENSKVKKEMLGCSNLNVMLYNRINRLI